MPGRNQELFSISAETPNGVPIHASAVAAGSAAATANFRRGIDLSAGFDFRAEASAQLDGDLAAKVAAGIGGRGGLALQVYFPLDLFSEAGLVARFRAQIEAAAFVRATVSLSFDEFY